MAQPPLLSPDFVSTVKIRLKNPRLKNPPTMSVAFSRHSPPTASFDNLVCRQVENGLSLIENHRLRTHFPVTTSRRLWNPSRMPFKKRRSNRCDTERTPQPTATGCRARRSTHRYTFTNKRLQFAHERLTRVSCRRPTFDQGSIHQLP